MHLSDTNGDLVLDADYLAAGQLGGRDPQGDGQGARPGILAHGPHLVLLGCSDDDLVNLSSRIC